MSILQIGCHDCTYENQIKVRDLRLNKKFSCINCDSVVLLVDRELLDSVGK
jgi:hypothetical protein